MMPDSAALVGWKVQYRLELFGTSLLSNTSPSNNEHAFASRHNPYVITFCI
jgi:hypothetical protein